MDEAIATFTASGFTETKQTKKVLEFRGSHSLEYVYLRLDGPAGSAFRIVVSPDTDLTAANPIAGVTVPNGFLFHSNMRQFPKQLHRGKTETHYGRSVSCDGPSALGAFLRWLENK